MNNIITSDGKQYKMPIFYCFYCKMDTAGNHELSCPLMQEWKWNREWNYLVYPSWIYTTWQNDLSTMANDPEIQKDMKRIEQEFRITELDGLDR